MEGESSSEATAEGVIQTLRSRGWSIGDDNNQIKALIVIQSALADDINDTSAISNSVESELLNMDLKSIGARSLPDPIKISHIQGPKVLQMSSVRDISVSSIEGFSGSINRRLLKFNLTDGHSEITAIEYSHLPSIPNDVVPGTKVRLENKATVQSGIVCLNPKVITLIGGVVQSLYEEWKMTQKYSTSSRSQLSQETDSGGPPQFEKLQIEAPFHRSSQYGKPADYFASASTSSSSVPVAANAQFKMHDKQQRDDKIDDRERTETFKERTREGPSMKEVAQKHLQHTNHPNQYGRGKKHRMNDKQEEPQVFTLDKEIDCSDSTFKSSVPRGSTEIRPDSQQNADDVDNNMTTSCPESVVQKPSNSEMRTKEVAESMPVQNQAASQKLLQKMSRPSQVERYSRGRKHKGKGKQEEQQVFTLDEREKLSAKPQLRNNLPDSSYDEDLARQLQNQLDVEDSHV